MEERSVPGKDGSMPIRFRQRPVTEEMTKENWSNVEAGIEKEYTSAKKRGTMRRAVAVLSIMLLLAAGGYIGRMIYCARTTNFTTAYGEIKRLVLPDSSIVYLNANSSISIPAVWDSEESRSVWLKGEAYFEITKRPGQGNAKFIVHTNNVDVEVLGTKFNVNILSQKTTVSLKEGKVQLMAKEVPEAGPGTYVMSPGEEVQFSEKKPFHKVFTNVEQIADWRNHRYHFDNTTLADITELIRTKFGYEVVIADTALNGRNISGDLSANDIDQFTKALSITMNIKIEKKDQQLIFKTKN
ncbi:FecR family protein [uncultured Chitinophaga sp.]|uniref:FecR family protein n=1 Tax=uncultured Chitinophaga sp. TaxID=339340 RepID=UPI0025D4CDFF|nr:FecR domain-containing protein [uncultured Chitinophaga sp.]